NKPGGEGRGKAGDGGGTASVRPSRVGVPADRLPHHRLPPHGSVARAEAAPGPAPAPLHAPHLAPRPGGPPPRPRGIVGRAVARCRAPARGPSRGRARGVLVAAGGGGGARRGRARGGV